MIITTQDQINELLVKLASVSATSFDIETDSLNPRKGNIIGFSLAWEGFECYVVHKAYENGSLIDVLPKEALSPIINMLKTKKIIGWNLSFDLRFVYHYFQTDLIPQIYFDGMLALHTVDEDRFTYGLKEYGAEVFGKDSKAQQEALKASMAKNGAERGQLYKADWQIIAEYGRQDARLTYDLYNYLLPKLFQKGLYDFYFNKEVIPFYKNTVIYMELFGMPVDIPYIEQSLKEIKQDLTDIEASIQAQIAPHLDLFNEWYMNKEYPVKFSGEFLQLLGDMVSPHWPKTKTGGYTLAAAELKKAFKKGLITPDDDLAQYTGWFYEDEHGVRKTGAKKRLDPKLVADIRANLHANSGQLYAFNILSKDHLKRLFFTKLKEIPVSTTDKGNPQVDEDFLEIMAKKYKWAEELITYNKLTKICGTYIERIYEEQENGRFYPSFFMHRTTSGRLSGDAQQLPRIKGPEELPNELVRKYNNRLRNFFISAPGWKLVDSDYTSLEVVVFADDSQDSALLDVIRQDLDLYSQVAINAWNLREYSADKKAHNFLKKHKPEKRQAAKSFALGFRYGLGTYKLSKDLNISESEAKAIYNNYFNSFPQLKKRMDEIVESAKKQGFVKSKSGRIRNLPELKRLCAQHGSILFDGLELWKEYHETPATYEDMKKKARLASNLINNSLNFPIQSLAASIVSQSSTNISKEFKDKNMQAYICLNVHDEVCVHSPDSEVEQVKEIMQRHMENTIKLSVPLQAEPIVGTRYGDVK